MRNGNTAFNILDCIRELRDAGFEQEQAEVQARHLELVKTEIESHLATKKDIEELKKETKRDIEELKKETKHDIELVRKDIEKLRSDTSLKIEKVRGEIEKFRGEIKREIGTLATKTDNQINNQTWKIIGFLGGLIALLKFLPDFFN